MMIWQTTTRTAGATSNIRHLRTPLAMETKLFYFRAVGRVTAQPQSGEMTM